MKKDLDTKIEVNRRASLTIPPSGRRGSSVDSIDPSFSMDSLDPKSQSNSVSPSSSQDSLSSDTQPSRSPRRVSFQLEEKISKLKQDQDKSAKPQLSKVRPSARSLTPVSVSVVFLSSFSKR